MGYAIGFHMIFQRGFHGILHNIPYRIFQRISYDIPEDSIGHFMVIPEDIPADLIRYII